MNFSNYLIVSFLAVILFLSTLLFNTYFFEKIDTSNKSIDVSNIFLQNSYAIEEDEDDEDNDKENEDDGSNNKKKKSIFSNILIIN